MHPSTADRNLPGLTLIEVTLALAVAGLILTGIHGIAVTTFELTSEIDQDRKLAAMRGAFLHFVEQQLRELPAEAEVTLGETGNDGTVLSSLVIRGAPEAFAFRPVGGHEQVELRGEPEPGGTRRIRLVYLSREGEIASLVLLSNLTQCDWRMRDASSGEWQPLWTDGLARPRLVELILAFPGEAPGRHVFWVPRLEPDLPSPPLRRPDPL